jgi:hypothetical protein
MGFRKGKLAFLNFDFDMTLISLLHSKLRLRLDQLLGVIAKQIKQRGGNLTFRNFDFDMTLISLLRA